MHIELVEIVNLAFYLYLMLKEYIPIVEGFIILATFLKGLYFPKITNPYIKSIYYNNNNTHF